jgi:hypothetical protein
VLVCSAAPAVITSSPFNYTGGPLRVLTGFNFYSSIETDGIGGSTKLANNNDPWRQNLQIIADPELLSGSKIPPVTPNVVDVRVMRDQTGAGFEDPTGRTSLYQPESS